MRQSKKSGTAGLITVIGWLAAAVPAAADDRIFDILEIGLDGRVVTANFADFDGDGRADLMLATLAGIPPDESRMLHVYLQTNAGFPSEPSHSVRIPQWSAVYDIADLRDQPGEELVLLRPDGVTIVSLAQADGPQWHLAVDGPSTVAASADERGFDSLRLVFDEFGSEPWILVPQIGQVSALTADGERVAKFDVGRRANYFVAKPTGLVSVESDIQLFLDVPKLSVGDVDGDGRADVVAATRHEIRVYLRETDGTFSSEPGRVLAPGLITAQDHIRGSGSVITSARDIDGDDLLDLMITHIEGTFADAITRTYVYLNRDGFWNLDAPSDRFENEGTLSSDLLMDTDSDGTLELVRVQLRFSVLEVVELLLTREIDAQIAIHRLSEDGKFGEKPWSRRKVSTGISFETFRPKGFMPRAGVDLNADGLMDFVTSANGKGIEVHLGDDKGPFGRRDALQRLPSVGVIRFSDFDGDGLSDFVLYDPQSLDATVRIGRNLGELPGSPLVAQRD